jgi:hypothetical protein
MVQTHIRIVAMGRVAILRHQRTALHQAICAGEKLAAIYEMDGRANDAREAWATVDRYRKDMDTVKHRLRLAEARVQ